MAKIISVLNHKGGVGKTTTTLNLAYYLGKKGKRVLVLDIDPQGSATTAFGIEKDSIIIKNSLAKVIVKDMSLTKCIMATNLNNIDIIPSTMDLITVNMQLMEQGKDFLNEFSEKVNSLSLLYDFIFFDCPPSVGVLNTSALAASDSVLIPVQSEYFATEGLHQILSHMRTVRAKYNNKLTIEGILLTMFDPRNNISVEIIREIKSNFKEKVYNSIIPRNIKLVEAAMKHLPIEALDARSKGALAYQKMADEFLEQNS